ncbi:MAG: putative N5, N10-methylenetetrahydromethanopterin reductase-related protein [uncultured Solirubrobacteraceae bacterium]|uniref:Putative N5, N10-methylenetetrahydromethanopterin reductase-related protein n=1 Tax=uncultured Solirubrobacteraceae bacterium TaxID=1162706 RepID=A0A6J4SGR8_9ACTN|nr:MAG: putative N5, N10-methylenetetrahydromethanopterin reductase-related protein [uncultured Solirubrobacteraceae bacterium]
MIDAMDIGLAIFPTADTPPPGDLARLVEERGFESIWFPEHTHIPASRETPYPAGGELPPEYSRTLDPFVALTAAAAATTRIRLGFGICLVIQRDPIVTAKAVASLDQVSGGRVLFGVGAGWNREEMRDHGTDPRTRMALLEERVEAMRLLWTEDEATYSGRFVSFERAWSWPKPVQQPHPPVLVGGNGPTVEDRVLAFGDAWMPNLVGRDDDALLGRIDALRRRAADAGRPVTVTVNAMSTRPERIARYAEAGVERICFYLPSASRDEIERRLERIDSGLKPVV